MSEIEIMLGCYRWSRERTLGLLEQIEKGPDPMKVLGWRPGPGRAHIAWQLMHIAITEEVYSTERILPGTTAGFRDLIPRFAGGSTPDDDIPTAARLREVLSVSRSHLEANLCKFCPSQLDEVPAPLKERGWTLRRVLQVLGWHEAHHQGQAHLTLNMWKAQQST